VAKNLEDDSFALIFGINTFLALLFQSLLTVIFISESGFALSTRGQFKAYGGYFLCLGGIFLVTALIKKCCNKR
jgi:thiamine transporter 2/3